MSEDLERFELTQRKAKAYAESGYWPDVKSVARAFVKLEAGHALGLNPMVAMSEVHVINEKPTLGAGALSTLVKTSGRYDYRVAKLTDTECAIRFFDRGEFIGESVFTHQDAERAELPKRNQVYRQYPRNMLFARAMSNGVAWYCPDVTSGRMYVPEDFAPLEEPALELDAAETLIIEPPPAT